MCLRGKSSAFCAAPSSPAPPFRVRASAASFITQLDCCCLIPLQQCTEPPEARSIPGVDSSGEASTSAMAKWQGVYAVLIQ